MKVTEKVRIFAHEYCKRILGVRAQRALTPRYHLTQNASSLTRTRMDNVFPSSKVEISRFSKKSDNFTFRTERQLA